MEKFEDIQDKNALLDKTKIICFCSFLSMSLIILFIMSPLSNLFITSILMKILAILILGYTIYLNINQSFIIQNIETNSKSKEYLSQLNINIICSYIFTLFLIILLILTLKSFFN